MESRGDFSNIVPQNVQLPGVLTAADRKAKTPGESDTDGLLMPALKLKPGGASAENLLAAQNSDVKLDAKLGSNCDYLITGVDITNLPTSASTANLGRAYSERDDSPKSGLPESDFVARQSSVQSSRVVWASQGTRMGSVPSWESRMGSMVSRGSLTPSMDRLSSHRGRRVSARNFHDVLQELANIHDGDLSNARSEVTRLRTENSRLVSMMEVEDGSPHSSRQSTVNIPPPSYYTMPRRVSLDESVSMMTAVRLDVEASERQGRSSSPDETEAEDLAEVALISRFFSAKEFTSHAVWKTDDPDGQRKKLQMARTLTPRTFKKVRPSSGCGNPDDSLILGEGFIQPFLVHPSSAKRMNWDLLSMAVLAWDIIMIPFTGAFDPEPTGFMTFMTWFTMVFWTFDMCASLLTGYQDGRHTVMDWRRILKRYLRSWFVLDALIVGLDWMLYSSDSAGSAARLGRSLRTLRFIRTLRLVRLLKIKRILHEIQDQINTEALSICFGILKIILVLVLANHIVACCWYGIGVYSASGVIDGATSWVVDNEMASRTLTYRYTTSLHWSLTQFTPASMEVVPRNVFERVFSVVVLLFAMITFSSFVSILTASMAELRNISSDETRQFWLLRRYLRDWKVSRRFSRRIERYLEYAYQKQRQRVQSKDVKLLVLLSAPLHDELKYETLQVHLGLHPLFQHCESGVRLFAKSLSEMSLAPGDVLFCCGEQASCMYTLTTGNFQYQLGNCKESHMESNLTNLAGGIWVAEAVLWTPWLHMGDLVALAESQVMSVNGHAFGQAVQVHKPMWLGFQRYAEKFVKALNDVKREDLTDLLHSVINVVEIVEDSNFRGTQEPLDEESDTDLSFGKLGRSIWRRAHRVTRFFEAGHCQVQVEREDDT